MPRPVVPQDVAGAPPAPDPSTVDRLLQAAAVAFADRGFHATTTRDIASRAGLSPAGVYVHFGSKEELLFNVSRAGHQSAVALLREAVVAAGPSAVDQLSAIMRRFSAWHAEQYQMARVVQYEHQHLTPLHHAEVLSLRKELDAIVRTVLETGVRTGEFAIDDIGHTALALLSIVVDVSRWYSPTIRRTPEEIGVTNAALSLRLVGARQ